MDKADSAGIVCYDAHMTDGAAILHRDEIAGLQNIGAFGVRN
ncbi:hypothetical protein [Xanthomonas phage Suba]|uniref:Uncharacterized protein n=1 Tax=Xanthomonas phage Suba TaxID=2674975 RepID=A0A679KLH7_9CAUD|nr:hypothetical protein QAY88_gp17 [Xanthomonas phage Suba]CAA2409774.1 hypothetical protein [Xanthomonas phage Suba]